jgi:diguanylate cyclase (GGDEF)-like protein
MARYLAVLFGAGATLSYLSLVVPHDALMNERAVFVASSLAYVATAILLVGGERLPLWSIHGLVIGGTAVITAGIHYSGGGVASAISAIFYVWVALFAFTFFTPATATGHVLLIAVVYAGELLLGDTGSQASAQWVLVVGTVAVTGYVVGRLANHNTTLAGTDPLTGLPNRRSFDTALAAELTRPSSDGAGLCVAVLDLDNFKHVNDTLGHLIGDELLCIIARRIEGALREQDLVARLGGDEFAIVLDDRIGARPAAVAERLLTAIAEPVELHGHTFVITASIGFARAVPGADAAALLRNADLAMYVAKSARAGGFEVFDDSMHERAVERLQLEMELREAVARREITVEFQPIVVIDTGRTKGVEVLARWYHPTRGPVPPPEFIGIAERIGLIGELGAQVFEQACQAAQRLHALDPSLDVTVNLSPVQLVDPDLGPRLASILTTHEVRPERVILEVTENALMQDVQVAAARLRELKAIGVRVAVDDFGVGHSSLSYLRNFPVDVLKIDKSFVDGLPGGGGQLARAVIQLGAMLGLDVVAEGIESQSQLDVLRVLGCGHGQGYLFARPMSRDALLDHLRIASGTADLPAS